MSARTRDIQLIARYDTPQSLSQISGVSGQDKSAERNVIQRDANHTYDAFLVANACTSTTRYLRQIALVSYLE